MSSSVPLSEPTGTPGTPIALAQLRDRVGRLVNGFSRGQRTTLTVAAMAVVGLVLAVSWVRSNVDYAPLYTGLGSSDLGVITKALQEKGVEYRIGAAGDSVEVPKDQVYQLRADLADVKLPTSGKVGYGILDDQGLTTSEFGQRVGFQRAMEGELGKTIEAINGVEAAVVHLAIPKDQVFALDQQKATASVMVKTGASATLAAEQVQAIRNLVASGIEGLNADDVTVADSEGHVLAAPGGAASGQSGVTDQRTSGYETSVGRAIEDMISASVGPGKAKATVSADLDFDQSTATKETFEPSPVPTGSSQQLALSESTKTETYDGANGATTAGILGTTDAATGAGTAATGNGYNLNERQVTNAVNKVTETTSRAPGSVKRLSVAVMVDEKALGEDKVALIERLVTAAAGIQASRGDSVVVTRLPFDETRQAQLQQDLEAHSPSEPASEMLPVYGAAGGLALLILIATFLVLRKRKRDLAELEELAQEAERLASESQPLPHTTQSPVISLTRNGGSPSGPTIHLDGPDRRRQDRREVLGELIDNQPDEVAQLLRGWLGDRREVSR